jgi:predicted RNase H-like HicB family nuclease
LHFKYLISDSRPMCQRRAAQKAAHFRHTSVRRGRDRRLRALAQARTAYYVGIVPGIRGAHTQAVSLDELRDNLKEVLALCLEGDDSAFAVALHC